MEEYFVHMGHLCIVLESLDLNMREILNKYGRNIGLSLPAVKLYAQQLFVALLFLKKNKIIHADCIFSLC
jgi:serine/threonine-protein kinase PRP4